MNLNRSSRPAHKNNNHIIYVQNLPWLIRLFKQNFAIQTCGHLSKNMQPHTLTCGCMCKSQNIYNICSCTSTMLRHVKLPKRIFQTCHHIFELQGFTKYAAARYKLRPNVSNIRPNFSNMQPHVQMTRDWKLILRLLLQVAFFDEPTML